MNLAPSVAKMIREYIAIHGDPFAPYETMTDFGRQETEHKCNGCGAIGLAKWPGWTLKIEHEPDCAWVAWTSALTNGGRDHG